LAAPVGVIDGSRRTALWWGGGPVLGLKTWGIQSPRLLRLVKGPLPLIAIALMLSFVWFAFWKEGRKVDREVEKLSTEQAAS
jgi:hypothetical protein